MIKSWSLTLFVLASFSLSAQEIKWLSFDDALKLQEEKPKKILLSFYTNWCGYCKMMSRDTFSNTDVAKYINEHYYAVKFNGEGNEKVSYLGKTFTNPNYSPRSRGRNATHQLKEYFGVQGYPSLVFLNEDAKLITLFSGYKTVKELEFMLKLFAEDDYLKLETQEAFDEYLENFVPKFN